MTQNILVVKVIKSPFVVIWSGEAGSGHRAPEQSESSLLSVCLSKAGLFHVVSVDLKLTNPDEPRDSASQ